MSSRWVYAALVCYVIGFALFPPRVFLVVDEERYVTQSVAFAHGERTVMPVNPAAPNLTPYGVEHDYPPGTSLLQTPFVALGGWRAAGLASVLALVVATLATMRGLRALGSDPGFALIVPAFPGSLFFARLGMSDVPATAAVALALWLLLRARATGAGVSFAAGLACGAIALFREPPLLLVAPLAAGAILRRSCVPWALVAGGIVGVGLRLVAYTLLVGSALHMRDPLYSFALREATHGLPMYAGILLLMLPGGALLPLFYRGPRKPELVLGLAAYVAVFVFFGYDAVRDNGLAKGVILSSRYMIPALPLLAIMAGDVVPRAAARVFQQRHDAPRTIAAAAGAAIAIAALAVHPLVRRQESVPLEVVREIIGETQQNVPVVTNTRATLKYLSPSYGGRIVVPSYGVHADSLARIARKAGVVDLVLLDRLDSRMFLEETRENGRLLDEVRARCAVQKAAEHDHGTWARMRVLRLSGCR